MSNPPVMRLVTLMITHYTVSNWRGERSVCMYSVITVDMKLRTVIYLNNSSVTSKCGY